MEDFSLQKILNHLSKVRVITKLKDGGQKSVFVAYHSDFSNIVLKVVVPSNSDEKKRALREINITSGLTSNLFARLYDFGEFEDNGITTIYIIEELLNGDSLRDVIKSYAPNIIPISLTKRVMDSLMEALSITEPVKLVHRDIKPENVVVCPERIVLIDFGIARRLDMASITDSFALFGPMTPGYAPPEQIKNQKRKISIRTDLFSLSVMFYELLSGSNPFHINADSPNQAITNTLNFQPASLTTLGYHPSFDTFIFNCLQKSCHRRPANMTQAMLIYNQLKWEV
ncbi:MAG: serine/threonine-protein kinase [archaeon]